MIDKNILNKLRRFYKIFTGSDRKSFYLLIVLMVIGALLEMMNIAVMTAFAGLISGNIDYLKYLPEFLKNSFINLTFKETILYGAILVSIASLIKNGYLILLVYIQNSMMMRHLNEIAEKLFKSYLYAKYDFFMNTNSSNVISQLRREVPNLILNVINSVLNIILSSIVLLFIILFMFIFQPAITLYVILISTIAYYVFIYFTKESIQKFSLSSQKQEKNIVRIIQESFSAFIEIRLNNLEERQLATFNKAISTQSNANKVVYFLTGSTNYIFEFTFTMIMIFSVVTLVYVSKVNEVLPLIIFLIYSIARIKTYASQISNSYSKMLNGIVAIDPVCDHLDMKKIDIHSHNKSSNSISFKENIFIDSVSFFHKNSGNDKLIDNITMRLNKGDSIGLVGKTGSGKTTLANIIAGLVPVSKGMIYIDGFDIKHNYKSWYKQISYVRQDVYIIDDTIRANIAFGERNYDIDNELLNQVIMCAELSSFINNLENGLDTIVGERGARLSGGQRQRIAIARALYKKPSLLILDEATSALDEETEKKVVINLDEFSQVNNLTQVVVSHKKSPLKYCDKVYFVNSGEVIEINNIEQIKL